MMFLTSLLVLFGRTKGVEKNTTSYRCGRVALTDASRDHAVSGMPMAQLASEEDVAVASVQAKYQTPANACGPSYVHSVICVARKLERHDLPRANALRLHNLRASSTCSYL